MKAEAQFSTWTCWDQGWEKIVCWLGLTCMASFGLTDIEQGWGLSLLDSSLLPALHHHSGEESEHHLLLPGVEWKFSCLSVLLLSPSRKIKVPPPASAEQEMKVSSRLSPPDTAEWEHWIAASCFCMTEVRRGGRSAWPAETTGTVACYSGCLKSIKYLSIIALGY